MIRWLRHKLLQRQIEASLRQRRLIRQARSQAARIGHSTEIHRRAQACRVLIEQGYL